MNRRGFSLTELLIVMGMTSVILTAGVGMVHRVMREQKFAARENVMHRVAERLSPRLRADVYFAYRAVLTESGDEREQRLVLYQPEQRNVIYTLCHNVLERASTREGGPTHRDSFRFPDNYRLEFVGDAKQVTFTAFAVPQAYLAIVRENSQCVVRESDVRRPVLRVEASVGRDHRFASKSPEPSES